MPKGGCLCWQPVAPRSPLPCRSRNSTSPVPRTEAALFSAAKERARFHQAHALASHRVHSWMLQLTRLGFRAAAWQLSHLPGYAAGGKEGTGQGDPPALFIPSVSAVVTSGAARTCCGDLMCEGVYNEDTRAVKKELSGDVEETDRDLACSRAMAGARRSCLAKLRRVLETTAWSGLFCSTDLGGWDKMEQSKKNRKGKKRLRAISFSWGNGLKKYQAFKQHTKNLFFHCKLTQQRLNGSVIRWDRHP